MFYVYVLQSKNTGAYYIGSCENIEERLRHHNSGFVRSTKTKIPWTLKYKEIFDTRSGALIRERQIKSWKKRSQIEKLFKHF